MVLSKQLAWCSGLDTVDQRPGNAVNRQVLNLFPEREFLNPHIVFQRLRLKIKP